jgi:hypothetical protein
MNTRNKTFELYNTLLKYNDENYNNFINIIIPKLISNFKEIKYINLLNPSIPLYELPDDSMNVNLYFNIFISGDCREQLFKNVYFGKIPINIFLGY